MLSYFPTEWRKNENKWLKEDTDSGDFLKKLKTTTKPTKTGMNIQKSNQ